MMPPVKHRKRKPQAATVAAGALPLSSQAITDDGDLDILEDPQARKLAKIVEGFGGQSDMNVRVWRIVNREAIYIDKFPLSSDLLDMVAGRWGGGDFRGRVIDAHNQFPKGGSFSFRIEGAAKQGARETDKPADGGAGMGDIMKMGVIELFQSMQRNNAATLEFVKAQSAPKSDIVGTLVALGTLASPFVLKWMETREKPMTREEMAEIVKGASRRESAPSRGVGEILEQLKGLDEVRELLGGGDDNGNRGSAAMGMFEKLAPLVTKILDRVPMATNGAQPVAEIAAPVYDASAHEHAAQRGATSEPLQGEAMPGDTPAWVASMRDYEPHIFNKAADGEDPRAFAESLRFWIPKGVQGQLREVLSDEHASDVILQNFPRLGMYPTWMADFIDELTLMFVGEPDDGADEPA